MFTLYPLLLMPEFHERVWGTRDLRPYFGLPVEGAPVGEVWMTGEQCRVANGPLAGETLGDLALRFGAELTGEAAPLAKRFPLLIKFLYPRQKLSVQVHPDDEGARRVGEVCGKTECWYVARAIAGAQVGLGLRAGITREMFRMAIEANQAEHMLNWLDVKAGEMIYVDAGTVHAIGANAIFVETQQNCDITYRLYDYGRPRELHLDEAIAVAKGEPHGAELRRQVPPDDVTLVRGPYFQLDQVVGLPSTEQAARYHGCLLVIPRSGAFCVEDEPVRAGQCALAHTLDDVVFDPQGSCLIAQPCWERA